MAFFDWDSKYDVGVNTMNAEHQKLIGLMNKLHEHHERGATMPVLQGHLTALAEYTKEHFRHEERYMDTLDYPEAKTHKLIHKDLLNKLDGHAADFRASGKLTPAFFSFLKMWLAAHICGIDKKYGTRSVAKAS